MTCLLLGPIPAALGERCLFAVENASSCLTVPSWTFPPSVICAMESLFYFTAKSIFLFPTGTFLEKALLLSCSYHCWCVDKEDVKLFIILANV